MSRLRAALQRHHTTGNLSVVVVGGSISAGAGAVDTHWCVRSLGGLAIVPPHDMRQSKTPLLQQNLYT